MKLGFQGQVKQNNSSGAARPGGEYNFDRAFTQPNPFVRREPTWATESPAFLLGYPASRVPRSSRGDGPAGPFYGWYFQDDFKVTSEADVESRAPL